MTEIELEPATPWTPDRIELAEAHELKALWEEAGPGLAESTMQRKLQAPLDTLITAGRIFQPRDMNEDRLSKKLHIRALENALESERGPLDPILVFPIAGHRIVIDGHCRLQAYQRTWGRKRPKHLVPIRYFHGSFAEALAESSRRNLKGKLPLTHQERLQRAWELLQSRETSKEKMTLKSITKATGASLRTVQRMAATLREIPKDSEGDPRGSLWRAHLAGKSAEEGAGRDWREDAQRKEEEVVDRWAETLAKTFGRKAGDHPGLFLRAVERFDSRLAEGIREELGLDPDSDPDGFYEVNDDF